MSVPEGSTQPRSVEHKPKVAPKENRDASLADTVAKERAERKASGEARADLKDGALGGLQEIADGGLSKDKAGKGAEKSNAVTPENETKEGAGMRRAEEQYVEKNGAKMSGLEDRYSDERTDYGHVNKQIVEFAAGSGLKHSEAPQLKGKNFDSESRGVIGQTVQEHIDTLFNSDKGRRNPEKQRLVTEQTNRYLDLINQAQTEGDIPVNLSAEAVLGLVEQNVWTLAYQDRVASENLLGDHGVRHLIGHNIRVVETIDNELARNGQEVRAVDRLIAHQAMMDHDLGYAVDPVREGVNEGKFGIDRGHNVLSAKYERQRGQNQADALGKVFSQDQIAAIHDGVLNHDSSEVNFHVNDGSEVARKENLASAIHVADNTHAFEDKLPELLYQHPDTLRTMRLMKTAGEIGDQATIQRLQEQLVSDIQANKDLSPDDKEALSASARSLQADNYKFTVGRICGNKPEFSMGRDGNVAISVQESAIHQEVVGLYGQQSHDQLRKFVSDLTGQDKKDVDLDRESIVSSNGKLEIKLKIGEQKATFQEKTDYQNRLEQMIANKPFQEFLIGNGESPGDAALSADQIRLQQELKKPNLEDNMRGAISTRIEAIKLQRRDKLNSYLDQANQ